MKFLVTKIKWVECQAMMLENSRKAAKILEMIDHFAGQVNPRLSDIRDPDRECVGGNIL